MNIKETRTILREQKTQRRIKQRVELAGQQATPCDCPVCVIKRILPGFVGEQEPAADPREMTIRPGSKAH